MQTFVKMLLKKTFKENFLRKEESSFFEKATKCLLSFDVSYTTGL